MKKRIMALLLISIMTAGISVTAFAKPSPEGGQIKIYGPDGKELLIVKLEEGEITGSLVCDHGDLCEGIIEVVTPVLSQYRDMVDRFDLNQFLAGTEYGDREWMKMFEMELLAKDCIEFPVTISFDKKDWAEGDPLLVHYEIEKEEWEIVDMEEKEDVYLAEFNSFSPVLFYQSVDAVEADGPVAEKPDMTTVIGAAVVVAAAAAGVVVMKKKKNG